MTAREKTLASIRFAGYHDDKAAGTRLYCEHRISYQAYAKAWNEGQRSRQRGVKCNCQDCNKEEPA